MMWNRIILLSIIAVSSTAALFPDGRIGSRHRITSSVDRDERQLQLYPTSPSYPHYSPHATTMQPSPEAPQSSPAVPTLARKTNPTFAPVTVEAPIAVSPVYYYAAKERADFEEYCVAYLISRYFTRDGLISQLDFAFFLTEYCAKESKMCEKDEDLKFSMLPTPIQLVFLGPLCAGKSLCLVEIAPEFGYVYNDETKEVVKIQMMELCSSLYPLIVGEYAAPAIAPTSSYHPPTAPVPVSPHANPTDSLDAPVYQPQYTPDNTPIQVMPSPITPQPVSLKTLMPTSDPPVFTPTEPTDSPVAPIVTTRQPTDSPTTEAPTTPTKSPVGPVFTPTQESDSPVTPPVSPNLSPETLDPTASPSPFATMPPVSSSPIISPETAAPTASPSLVPSSSPSLVSSSSPSLVPSISPSGTPAVVFINEIYVSAGNLFVEVSYFSFLGSGIELYSIHGYDATGMIVGSGNLTEGSSETNGLTFTVVTISNTTDAAEAFALVGGLLGEVLHFLSNGISITAVNGPAEGMISTDISVPQSNTMPPDNSRFLQLPENQNDTSLSLTGVGCDFDDFVFTERPSTPGAPNIDQEIEGCRSPPTAAPIEIGGGNGLSAGAIVGIAVSSTVLVVVLLYLLSGRTNSGRTSGGAQVTEETMIPFDAQQAKVEIGPEEEFMADTGSSLFGEGSDMANVQGIGKTFGSGEEESNSSGIWWNSVFWMGGGRGGGGSNVSGMGSVAENVQLDQAGDAVSSGVDPAVVALAAGAAIGTKNKRRNWFRRRANDNDSDEEEEDAKIPAGTDDITGESRGDPRDDAVVEPKRKRKAKSKRLSAAAAKASFAEGDAASIALARKDEDANVDSKAIPAADANSEALENLDAALDKHDWDAIYSIADTIRTDSPASGSGPRQPLGFAAASKGVSKAASAALPSDSDSDAASVSDVVSSALGGSETTGSVSGILGAARGKDSSPASVSELSSKSDSGIIGASPRKGDYPDSEAVDTDSKISGKVGWTSLFRRKGRKGRKSPGDSGRLAAAAEIEPDEEEGGANVLQVSMQALQQEFPDTPTRAVDMQYSSIGTGSISPLDEWGSHDSEARQGSNSQEAEQDAAKLDIGTKSTDLEERKTLLVDSIQQISKDLESSALAENDDPSLAGPGMEEEIERLIASKDWKALGDFANREEVFIENERHTIEARGEIFTSDAERLARQNVKKEFQESMQTLRTTERPDGTSFETNQDIPDDRSSGSTSS